MKLYVNFNFNKLCKKVLETQLNNLGLGYAIHGLNEIEFNNTLNEEELSTLKTKLEENHIAVLEDKKMAMIEQIKNAVDEMLKDEKSHLLKSSSYLADKLNYSYAYLSSLFSEATYISIEHYIILRKVDFVKNYLLNTDLTLTEIAFKLNYSSVAHLSGQFKKTTGLTPSAFQRIIAKRKAVQT
ncbi:MAG TPA: AraC family transcriptional regulator [Flavobacteriaceae bacterium]|nr:AraC family transcriptional regulator [Flavobacteriaceae bacterium]